MAIATGTALLAGSAIAGAGAVASGVMTGKAQKKAANAQYQAQMEAIQKGKPLDIRQEMGELPQDPTEMYLVRPTVDIVEGKKQEAFIPQSNLGQDLGLVRERVEQRFEEGAISTEQQQQMMRFYRTEAARAGQQYGREFQQGQIAGGFAGSRQAPQERIIGRMAQQVAQNAYNLQLQNLESQMRAEQELLALGREEESRQLAIERENIARDIANTQIEQSVRSQNMQNIDRWNNMMLNQQSLYAQQGMRLAEATAQYQANMLQSKQSYYNGIANMTTQIGTGLAQYGAFQHQSAMQDKFFDKMLAMQQARNTTIMQGTPTSIGTPTYSGFAPQVAS